MATRGRGGVLSEVVNAYIILDIEANTGIKASELQKKREEYKEYPEAVRNRFNHLSSLKKNKPDRYWSLFAEATTNVGVPQTRTEQFDDVEEERDEAEQVQSTPSKASRSRRYTSFAPTAPYPSPVLSVSSKPNKSPFTSPTRSRMSSGSSTRRAADAVRPLTQNRFADLNAAIAESKFLVASGSVPFQILLTLLFRS